ncbi:Gfo/Idh/MocA family oxidoreductase [Eubacteriales bacterium OttesenSCG-928-N13]|nr:Gfo/Idh/MocA family oxidoreductase [Eubacteriales bacterium OttesenSCG-928-N13]
MKRVKVGLVGCGNISGIYLTNLTNMFKDTVELVAVCDIIKERADQAKEEYGIPKAYYTDADIMADDEIELIVNITPPAEHKTVNMLAMQAGKHAYCEKPLAINRADGEEQIAYARAHNLLLGGAPDTFLGGGLQTCRKLIDEGWIGDLVLVTATMLGHGPESWHPDPEFFYKKGAGPMFDMGPYYLTALTNLMGSVDSVMGSAVISFPERRITSEKHYGEIIEVEVPTRIVGTLNFKSGATGVLITSFDIWSDYSQTPITIYGSKGSLRVPDPNCFGGPIQLLRAGSQEWENVPVVYDYQDNSRGLGVSDLCVALREGRKPRGNCDQTFHVLDLMCAFHEASDQGKQVKLNSGFDRQPLRAL